MSPIIFHLPSFAQPKLTNKPFDWEKGYYVGQEYIEDTEKISAVIEANFFSPAVLEAFEFYLYGKKVKVHQDGGSLNVEIELIISKRLFADLESKKDGVVFYIIGYISPILPRINQEILKQRYSSGHLLVRTYSTLDIYLLSLINTQSSNKIPLAWPRSVNTFPQTEQGVTSTDEVYIRDLIDASNSYLNNNFDDCIRKVITSIENTFVVKRIGRRWLFWKRPKSFVGKLLNAVPGMDLGSTIIRENLIYIYRIRNSIVHNKYRLKHSNGWFAKKAVGTLMYFHQLIAQGKNNDWRYVCYLQGQFLTLDNFSKGENLDLMEKLKTNEPRVIPPEKIVDSPQKLDKVMFEMLRITKENKALL